MTGEEKQMPINNAVVIGINILILIGYSIFCLTQRGGAFLDAFLIFLHFFACIIIAAIKENRTWVLAGLLVVIIGFASCVNYGK